MALTVVHHPGYTIDLPANHPFPMEKFRLLRQLLGEQSLACPIEWLTPEPAPINTLARVHTRDYLNAFLQGRLARAAERRSGFAWSEALVERVRLETGGTLLTLEAALTSGLACNSAGGTHHAHADAASGYCLINDLAVAAAHALALGWVERVLIVDCDVHQGDGTARLFANVPGVFTFSMHAARNFPARKATSDLDVALPNGMGDDAYLAELASWLPGILAAYQPDAVLYDAGVDVHQDDRLGYLALSNQGLYARDHYVLSCCHDADIPVAAVIGGGYDRDILALAGRHAQLHRAAADVLTFNA
ncbi:histone deacetylase [Halomonas sp. M1]|uniref:histone deacetylase family protein n=1 Tax=Halomonas sp. M1 TaxID=3035470 RepID=UPI002485DB43|nr:MULTISPECIES: histone deacetylase [unclassified Halomonas]MDP3534365.1 histone deacetylase [Halomonas sp.]WFE69955.1 histone deacetylase [Halomonas sp. M1]